MKKSIIICIVSLFVCSHFLVAQDGQIKKQIRSEYVVFLNEEGFSPTIDEDGDIKFKREGQTFYINVFDEQSPQFVIITGQGFQVGGEDGFDKTKAALAVNEVNKKTRVVKLMLYEKSVRVAVEMSFVNTESFKGVFYKILSYIESGRECFLEEYKKL